MNYAIDTLLRAAEDADRDRETHAEELAELTAERDAAVAEARRLTAALAAARREGAEAMRAKCLGRLEEMLDELHENGAGRDAAAQALTDAHEYMRSSLCRIDDAPGGAPDCTGITARWCPRCGDCACGPLYDGDCADGERTLNDPKCPLHAPPSPHGDAPGGVRGAASAEELSPVGLWRVAVVGHAPRGVCRSQR